MIIFDLDGTLYEDPAIYDRYAEELARFIDETRSREYLEAWEAAKRGEGVVRIGLGYDTERDRLFRYDRGRITAYLDWAGHEDALPVEGATAPDDRALFGTSHLNLGDWWGIPQALAGHYGVGREQRDTAFHATRDFMATDAWAIHPEPGLPAVLDHLRSAGIRLIAMTNSPRPTSLDVLRQLGPLDRFDEVVASAEKPYGLARFLETVADPTDVLSIGDNYVNDIEPVLEVGGAALYIDRHATGLGAEYSRCGRVRSIGQVPGWLEEWVSSTTEF